MLLDQLGETCGGLINVFGPSDGHFEIFSSWRIKVSPEHEPHQAEELERTPLATVTLDLRAEWYSLPQRRQDVR